MFISCRLKELRVQKQLTQESFAEKAGFNYKFYQNLELGRSKYIRLDTIVRLADAFDMEVWELLKPPANFKLEKVKRKIGRPPKKCIPE